MDRIRQIFMRNYGRAISTRLTLSDRVKEYLQKALQDEKQFLADIEAILPYIEFTHNLPESSRDPRPLQALQEDVDILRQFFIHLLYEDLLNAPIDKALEYLRFHPEYIFTTVFDDEPLIFHTTDYESGEFVYGIAAILHDFANNAKEERVNLTAVFERRLSAGRNTLAENWATLSYQLEGAPKLDFIKALIEVSPSHEKILFIDDDPRSGDKTIAELITEVGCDLLNDPEQEDSYLAYRQEQIAQGQPIVSTIVERLAFVVAILQRNGYTIGNIFTYMVIDYIRSSLILYIDSPYLARWLDEYPEMHKMLRMYISVDDNALLNEYLLSIENQRARDVVLNLDDEESLVHGVMSTVDKQTDKLRMLNLE